MKSLETNFPLFIAGRYFFSRSNQAVTIIVWVSIMALVVATAAMLIILNAFSGLEKMNLSMFDALDPDIKISSYQGKRLQDSQLIEQKLQDSKKVASYSKVIEEKVYISFGGNDDIAYLKGIELSYKEVLPMDSLVTDGSHVFSAENSQQLILGGEVFYNLNGTVTDTDSIALYVPKSGKGLILDESDAFNTQKAAPIGLIGFTEKLSTKVFAPIGLVQNLLELNSDAAYTFEIRLNKGESLDIFKKEFEQSLGENKALYKVETRYAQEASFIKIMNVERFVIYLIFCLMVFLTLFNLVGALSILMLDKKPHIHTLWSLGIELRQAKRIFFYLGVIILGVSIFLGLLLGSFASVLQLSFGFVKATPYMAFPIEIDFRNYLVIALTVLAMGTITSFFVSRRMKFNS